jgi:hypothetical protein
MGGPVLGFTMSSLTQLYKALKSDSLVQSRNIEITTKDKSIVVEEFGNPALEIDDTQSGGPQLVETGEIHLSNHVQYIADTVLGHQNYRCTVYEDADGSRTEIHI